MAMPELLAEIVVGLAVATTIAAPFASSLEPFSMCGSMAPAMPLQQSTATSQELLAEVGLAVGATIVAPFASSLEPFSLSGSMAHAVPLQ